LKFKELEVVRTTVSFPEFNINKGDSGTIVIAFTSPHEAYEVEFVCKNGSTKAMFAILPEHLELIYSE